jgi:hypothetical protein
MDCLLLFHLFLVQYLNHHDKYTNINFLAATTCTYFFSLLMVRTVGILLSS